MGNVDRDQHLEIDKVRGGTVDEAYKEGFGLIDRAIEEAVDRRTGVSATVRLEELLQKREGEVGKVDGFKRGVEYLHREGVLVIFPGTDALTQKR